MNWIIIVLYLLDLNGLFIKHFQVDAHQQMCAVNGWNLMQNKYSYHVYEKTKIFSPVILRMAENLKLKINDMDMR